MDLTIPRPDEGNVPSDRYLALVGLGEGAWLRSILARDAVENVHVVLRTAVPALTEDPEFLGALERASLEALRVRHPHIVRVIDAGRTRGVPFYAAEYIKGDTLEHRLGSSQRAQAADQVYGWLIDVAEALDFIHAKKATHRGVKPAAILFSRDGRVCITDYVLGAALGMLGEEREADENSKPTFVAPEVLAGERPTPAADQYGLAATVFAAITGEAPPEDLEDRAAALEPHISGEAVDDVLRGLEADPESRFPSCYEFARAFGLERKRLSRNRVPGPPPLSVAPREFPSRAAEPDDTDFERDEFPESLPDLAGRRCWRLRMGPNDEYARWARDANRVAVGHPELGRLEWLTRNQEEAPLVRLVSEVEHTEGASGLPARLAAAELWRFVREMQRGDVVLVPNPSEELLHVGRISGGASYEPDPSDGCRLPRRRPVVWIRDVPFAETPNAVRRTLDGPTLLQGLESRTQAGIELATPAGASAETKRLTELLGGVVAALRRRPAASFGDSLRTVFAELGFDAEVTPSGQHETWEASGILSGGLLDVPLRVWVHRTPGKLDDSAIEEARAGLSTDEYGAVASLDGFTHAAREAAAGNKPIRLLDGETLASLFLESWNALPQAVRDDLGVQRSERTTIEYSFHPTAKGERRS